MLPQSLVQNKIISKDDTDNFQINWSVAAPILNTNFFYFDGLVNESAKYRLFLRPWQKVAAPATSGTLKLHQYYTALENDNTYHIHVGDWVGRVQNLSNTYKEDCLVLTQSAKYYIYDNVDKKWVLNTTAGVPCIIRPDLCGLNQIKTVDLDDAKIIKNNNHWQYICHSEDFQFVPSNGCNPALAFSTDAIMGRVLYENQLIANVPVTITRKWNPQIIAYEFSLSFPDFNFPTTAQVEFW